ncbi:uncharacterized protein BYT42DRAFT_589509 [Radiomyces spectabilis]|uniref:uncharacterized protein n=1 Tax=Radiomyces spectabilis TaxID=64574 RepID=UPI00221EE964|nr:uncharacterized protein BYT42DRAFT_589509 [Radiomyces spectabilis]KAI8365313.1 hypothetical protein BYT42DRAFT_589509 [Radiomyces spectabilis]
MNSVHDTKEWHLSETPLQNSPMNDCTTQSSPHPTQQYSPMPTMDQGYGHPYPPGNLHPMHPYPPMVPSNYMSPMKPESDPRLPGMMALSQPGTPRPSGYMNDLSPGKKREGPYMSSFHATPYPSAMVARKRMRNDPLFLSEAGPFFSSTKPFDNLYAFDRTTLLTARIHSKMDRGFFLADNDWTCYRRNYFQISSTLQLHGYNRYYLEQGPQCYVQTSEGTFLSVRRFLIGISARVANSDKQIELVQHTPKRDKGPQLKPELKPITPGGNLNMSAVGTNQNVATFERIQFKTATANNGKRRAAQQYYVCNVDLYAETENGNIKVASCQSAPLVVRGRSPGHYADSQDKYKQEIHPDAGISVQPPHDDRFTAAPFPRPPITPPGIMANEYGTSYPYYHNYGHFAPAPLHNQLQPPTSMVMTSGPPTPTTVGSSIYNPSHPASPHHYMMPNRSSASSSPVLYHGEFAHQQQQHQQQQSPHPVPNQPSEDPKIAQPHPSTPGLNIHIPLDASATADWTRSRYHSAESSVPSPAPDQAQNSYFAQATPALSSSSASQISAFSPTTPTTPYAPRKYNPAPAMENQQTS